jgi:hypothetical protein
MDYTIEFDTYVTPELVTGAFEMLGVIIYQMPKRWPGLVEARLTEAQLNELALHDGVLSIDRM